MTTYRLRTVRLINFHNFVDVEIPVQGHLFLVGDNASGKTTVLDAVQWALSGGQDLEFNAAAQLWGAKQDGRTLRGAVLRTDLEKGDQRTGRTITYAAVELETEEGERWSLGVGAELAHPEAPIQSWGFMRPGPLSEIPLLLEGPGGSRPSTKEELRERLGADRVHFLIGRYQKMVADRFTRGDDSFRRLTEFWKLSKAYKQMAEKTRDYSELLRNMLPRPDGESFLQVKRGLDDLRAVEGRLDSLRAQRTYMENLAKELVEIGRHREAVARYHYLEARWVRDRLLDQVNDGEKSADQIRIETETCRAAFSAFQSDRASREGELFDLRAKDQEGLLERRDRLVQETEEAQRLRAAFQKTADEKAMGIPRAVQRVQRVRRDFVARLALAKTPLAETAKNAGPSLQAYLASLDDVATQAHPEQAWAALDARPARREILELQSEADRAAAQAEGLRQESDKDERQWRETLEEWARTPEPLPSLVGYEACLRRLEQDGLKVRPLYQWVEKGTDADEGLFRDLEAALGEQCWSALVPDPEDAAQTAATVLAEFPGIPVVRTDLPALPSVPWLESLLDWERLPEEARGYLRRLAHASPTAGVRLEGEGRVEDRGARLRVLPLRDPLLGAEARRETRRKNVEAATQRWDQAKARNAVLAEEIEKNRHRSDALRQALTLLSESREGDFPVLARECQQAVEAESRAREDGGRAREELARQTAEGERLTRALESLRARLAQEGLEGLESRLADAERAVSVLREAEGQERERQGELKRAAEDARQRAESLAVELTSAQEDLVIRARRLEPLVSEEYQRDVDGYAWDVKQGRRIASVENVREKIREAERTYYMAVAHVEGEGGVLHPEYGPLFGLTYEVEAHRIIHRTGQPLAVFLEAFSAQVQEHESALDQDRQKLFKEVIQGHLARKLQREILDLEQTVREVDRLLKARVFGRRTRYRIRFHPRPEHAHFISVVKRLAAFDAAGQGEFEAEIKERLASLPSEGGDLPEAFDYRYWYEFQLMMGGESDEGVELKPTKARLGSGGEQAVPKYIIILAMASLLFRASESSLRVLLFDEVFYGIDKARREELLTLATEMDFQLVVASPEQAGDRESYRKATTAFVVKDTDNNVHVVPAHIWTDRPADLFQEPKETR
jgi:energy-coupling factor transporter ATP-binding protein EcfA2